MKIGEIIEELRTDRGMLQRDLGKFLNVSVATISHYETGKNIPDLNTLTRMADLFEVSTDYLLGRTNLKMDWNTFRRTVRLSNGTIVTADKVLTNFMRLSEDSQFEVYRLMDLYYYGNVMRQSKFWQGREQIHRDRGK